MEAARRSAVWYHEREWYIVGNEQQDPLVRAGLLPGANEGDRGTPTTGFTP